MSEKNKKCRPHRTARSTSNRHLEGRNSSRSVYSNIEFHGDVSVSLQAERELKKRRERKAQEAYNERRENYLQKDGTPEYLESYLSHSAKIIPFPNNQLQRLQVSHPWVTEEDFRIMTKNNRGIDYKVIQGRYGELHALKHLKEIGFYEDSIEDLNLTHIESPTDQSWDIEAKFCNKKYNIDVKCFQHSTWNRQLSLRYKDLGETILLYTINAPVKVKPKVDFFGFLPPEIVSYYIGLDYLSWEEKVNVPSWAFVKSTPDIWQNAYKVHLSLQGSVKYPKLFSMHPITLFPYLINRAECALVCEKEFNKFMDDHADNLYKLQQFFKYSGGEEKIQSLLEFRSEKKKSSILRKKAA